MVVQEIMTDSPACCTPNNSMRDAAMLMVENDCGCLPVVEDMENRRIVGVVTDRDLTCRGIAQGRDFETPLRDVMTSDPRCCRPGDDIHTVEQIMSEIQVRRVPVIDNEGICVGMVAQADLARDRDEISSAEVGRIVERVSEPTSTANNM